MGQVDPSGARTLPVRRRRLGAFAIGAALVAVGLLPLLGGAAPAERDPPASAEATGGASATARAAADELDPIVTDPPDDLVPVADEARLEPPAPPPVGIEIPRLGIDADVQDIDLDAARRLDAPADPAVAGWYVRSPEPGEVGPALIAGHVDSRATGPGVFHRLHELEPGDKVTVAREDGSRAEFVVRKVGRWPKDQVPTDEVYRKADGSELRLITCGGDFDRARGSYRDNIVVFASTLASPVRTPVAADA